MARKKKSNRGLLMLVVLVAVVSAGAFGLDRLDRDLSSRGAALIAEAEVLYSRAGEASSDGWRRADAVARTVALGGVEADLCRALLGETWYLPALPRTRALAREDLVLGLSEGTACQDGDNSLTFRF